MKTCQNCKKEIPDEDWICPFCHQHVGSVIKGTGHSTLGKFEDEKEKMTVSEEDDSMIREGSQITDDSDDYRY